MTTWVNNKHDVLWTCDCGETSTQLSVFDWDDTIIIEMSDRPSSFWSRLWRFIQHGDSWFGDIILRPEDALSLAEALTKYVKNTHEPRTGLGEYAYEEEPTGWIDVVAVGILFSIPFFLGLVVGLLI